MTFRLLRISFYLFLFTAFVGPADAATYFVDFAGGSDFSSGRTTASPFKHSPGDDNATGIANTTTLVPGDIVIFRGGIVYQGEVDLDWSGSSGAPITYDGNSAGTWGTGMAVFDLNATYYSAFNGITPRDYITIKNFKIHNAKNVNNRPNQTVTRNGIDVTGVNYGGGSDGHHGFIYNNGGSNWSISDCKIYEAENWSDRSVLGAETDANPQTSPNVPADQVGINFSNSSDSTISNVVIWAIGRDCMRLLNVTGLTIENCNFGGDSDAGANVGWFSVAIRIGGGTRNLVVRDSSFHDGWQYQGDESQQRSHAGDWIHAFGNNNGIFEADKDPNNIVIERCYFYNNHAFSYSAGTATAFLEDDVFDFTFRNNLFINDFSGSLEIERVRNVMIFHNTFLSFSPTRAGAHIPLFFFTGSGGSYPVGVKIKNNIFVSLNTNSVGQPIGTSSRGIGEYPESDYNRFYAPNAGNFVVRWNGVNKTLATWRNESGQDLNSSYGDPQLADIQSIPGPNSAGNYRPASTYSPVVSAGAILAGIGDDFFRLLRSGGADIGAVYFSGPRSPRIPQNLRRVLP